MWASFKEDNSSEILQESIVSSKFVSHIVRMSGEYDSSKDSQLTKLCMPVKMT